MPRVPEDLLLQLLQACAASAPEPLYPARYAAAHKVDRDVLDVGLEELRRRGLVKLTDWVREAGQGYALTEAGRQALESKRLPTERAAASVVAQPTEMTDYERGEIVRNSIFEPTKPYVSRILLAANLVYFIFGAVYAATNGLDAGEYIAGNSPTTSIVLFRLGGLDRRLVFSPDKVREEGFAVYSPRPQYERIVLSCFLHIGIFHLFMNMYFLYSLGPLIESMWGTGRFAAIYGVAGIVGGCVVLLLQTHPGMTAGASGCLFGIFLAMVVWFFLNRRFLPDRLIEDWSRNLATNGVLLIVINFVPGVSWQGHLGGAIGGCLAALVLQVARFHPMRGIRWLALAALPIIPIGFFAAVLWQAGRL